jgi:PleD family two-component response regulator
MDDRTSQPASLLVATEGEWAGRSLESALSGTRYTVVRTREDRETIAWVRRSRPDAIILDEALPDSGGVAVCRQLRDDPTFDPATPIVITAAALASAGARQKAYAAGAWEFCSQPLDVDVLMMKIETFVRAKRALAVAKGESITDADTGVLSARGMEYWAEQLIARAQRNHEPLACVVLMPVSQTMVPDEQARQLAGFVEMTKAHFRRSDIVGRISDGRLALLAPDTDRAGVLKFVERLRSALAGPATATRPDSGFRAGYYAVDDLASAPVEPREFMRRASTALDQASVLAAADLAFGFDQLPVS